MTALPQNLDNTVALTAQNVKQNTPATQPAVNDNAPAPLPAPSTSLMINMKQTLGNIIPIDTSRTASTATATPATPVLTPTVVPMSSLIQSLNNKQQDKVEASAPIQGTGTINGLPEGDYAALSFALSVSAGALSAVNEAIGLNAAQISVMNAAFGKGLEAMYQQNMSQAEATLEKENDKTHLCKVFGDIGKHLGQVASAAIIVAGLITADPALVAIGCILLAMSINVVSSHITDGIADGLMQIPGMEGRETLAQGIATGLVLAATIVVCVAVGNVAGAEEAAGEAVEEGTGEAAGEAVGAADVSSSSANLAQSSARIATEIGQGDIDAGEKTMFQLVQDTVNSMLQFIQENPQQLLDAVKKGATAGQAVVSIGQAVVQGQLAKLSVQYGNTQATIEGVDFSFNTLSQRNQTNMSLYADIEKSNAKMINDGFNSAAQAGLAYANILA